MVGGVNFDAGNDKLALDVERSLSSDFSASAVTIGSLTGLSYNYVASTKTLQIWKADNTAFAPANFPTLIAALSFKTTSATQGDRTLTLSYIDALGNAGATSVITLTVDSVISAPVLRLASDDGTNPNDGITTNGTVNVSNIAADSTWSYSTDAGATWTAGSGSSVNLASAGVKALLVKATDAAGNTATSTLNFTVASALSKTVTISSATDDVSTNGSATGVITAGNSTDDTTPTLAGTVSVALAAGESVVVYDGVTKLGTGTNWTYTPSALSDGAHSFVARVEDSQTSAQGSSSVAVQVRTQTAAGLAMKVIDDVGALTGEVANNTSTDDLTPTLSGKLAVTLGSSEELAIYQTLNGVTTKLGVATVTGSDWSLTSSTLNAVGTYTFKAIVQPVGAASASSGYVVSSSSSINMTTTDDAFTGITNTDPTSGLSVKALSVASSKTLNMQSFSHNEIDVLNLGAGAKAMIDLGDIMQNGTNLFSAPTFAGLSATTSLKQMVINGSATSSVVMDTSIASGTWTKAAGSVTNSGHTYDVYNNSNGVGQLLIDQLVQRSGGVI